MSEPIIKCQSLKKSFRSGAEELTILNGVDFELRRGSICTVLGPSGSGKSTFLAILGSLERFDAGSVSVCGYNLGEMQEKTLHLFRRDVVGFVFQFHFLLNDFTALENVALPRYVAGVSRSDAWASAQKLLDLVGLSDRAGHYPTQLSGGERQRVAIARALVNEPAILLADEPTGNLDAANASDVSKLMRQLPEATGTTLVLVTHDPELAAVGSTSFLLKGGALECLR